MNDVQIAKIAAKAAARASLTDRAAADLRQRADDNYDVLCTAFRREHADETFTLDEGEVCPVRDLPRWAFVEWLNNCYSTEFDSRMRAARLISIASVENIYGIYLKEERAWYASFED